MQRFLQNGFTLKEDIIKHQHNCKATGFWVNKSKRSKLFIDYAWASICILKKINENIKKPSIILRD